MHLKKEILELKLFSQKVFKIPTILQLSFFKSVGQLLQKFESWKYFSPWKLFE